MIIINVCILYVLWIGLYAAFVFTLNQLQKIQAQQLELMEFLQKLTNQWLEMSEVDRCHE